MSSTSTWTETIGLDPAALVDQLLNKGLSKYDASRLVNNLVAVNLGQSPRYFTFTSPLPVTDPPDCAPKFVRSFSHQDWVDGESVVQAGESADDKGFNWRFNAIGADLDALHADVVQLFQCLSSLRQALVQALHDVALELNRIDSDVAGVSTKVPPQISPWQVNITDAPQFLGVRELDGSKVTMWKAGGNVLMLPGVNTVGLQDTVSQRIATGGLLSRFADANAEFAQDLSAGQPVKDLIAKYGSQTLGDGRTVAQGLAVLPPDATYAAPQAAIDAVNAQEQAFLRSTIGSVDAVSAVVGVTSSGAPLASVSPAAIAGAVAGAPSEVGTALTRAGLTTVDEVAAVPPDQLVTRLAEQGVALSEGQARELLTRASMVAGLGQQIG
ncbi:MAG: hypothetical protein ACJ74O_18150 [Frankiaceae bacterium]